MSTIQKIWKLTKKMFTPLVLLCIAYLGAAILLNPGTWGIIFMIGWLTSTDNIKDSGFGPIITWVIFCGLAYLGCTWLEKNSTGKTIIDIIPYIITIIVAFKEYKRENFYYANQLKKIELKRAMRTTAVLYPMGFIISYAIKCIMILITNLPNTFLWENVSLVCLMLGCISWIIYMILFAYCLFSTNHTRNPQYAYAPNKKNEPIVIQADIEKAMRGVASYFNGGYETIRHGSVTFTTTVSVYDQNIRFVIGGKMNIDKDAGTDPHAETAIRDSLSSIIQKRQQRILEKAESTLSKMNTDRDYYITVDVDK